MATDIAGERARLKAQGLDIITREEWGAAFQLLIDGRWVNGYTTSRAVDRPADMLFLHISVTIDGGDLPKNEYLAMRTIEVIGIDRFPKTGFSYNASCFDTGRLYEGQPLTRRGAHTINTYQREICPAHGGSLVGPSWNLNVNARALVLPQMLSDDVTDAQIRGAARWGAACIRAGEVKRGARWHGHRCVTNKDCPGARGYARIPELQRLTDQYVANGLPPLEEDMAEVDLTTAAIEDVAKRTVGIPVGTTGKSIGGFAQEHSAALAALLAAANDDAARDALVLAALQAGGGDADTAVVVAAVNAARDELSAKLAELQSELDDREAKIAELTRRLAAAGAELDGPGPS